jgi:hypothetical protein
MYCHGGKIVRCSKSGLLRVSYYIVGNCIYLSIYLSIIYLSERPQPLLSTQTLSMPRAAAVCLRLTEPWHNQVPRMLIADAWFGGVPTAVQLIHGGLYCITNVKTHTNHFCKKELRKDALGRKRNHERKDRAYRELILTITGKDTTLHGAFHMEKAPMTLLGTTWSSQAPMGRPRRCHR